MPVTADTQGTIQGQFTVPPDVPTGTKQVQFIGSQGSFGTATYTGKGTITTEERRQVTLIPTARTDPLAQTFTLTESRFLGGVELWFTNKGAHTVTVQVRETQLGLPNQTVIAQGMIQPSSIHTDGRPSRITWTPVWCEAGREYALVILTDDADTAVRIAELGQYDALQKRWVTSQPYQVGVLLSSSNASTWTAHQTVDLTFRLLAATFTEFTRTINLGPVKADQCSDLLVLANVARTGVNTAVRFTVTTTDGQLLSLSEDTPLALRTRLTGPLAVQAELQGDKTHSPVLYPGIHVILGQMAETGDYVTRSLPAGTNVTLSVTYEVLIPGTADVTVFAQKADGTWQKMNVVTGKPVGEEWVERTHKLTGFTATETRIKLVLSGTVIYRPKVRGLRVVVM